MSASVPERGIAARLVADPGRTVALLGPNGAGKSTMLAVAAGLLRPDDAHVRLTGDAELVCQDQRAWVPPHRRPLTLLTQDASLFAGMSVLDNVAFGPRAEGLSRRHARAAARDWLDAVGLAGLASSRAETLSGGQAQRVALARALATAPAVLLLDEPFAALDVDAAGAMRALLAQLLRDVTVVMATHDLLDAAMLADDVVVMHDGAVAERGPLSEVLARPRHDFTASLVGRGLVRRDDGTSIAPRPSQVRVTTAHATLASGGGVTGAVRRVEAHADAVRIWVEVPGGRLGADVDPLTVDPRVLTPGTTVTCVVADGVESYGSSAA